MDPKGLDLIYEALRLIGPVGGSGILVLGWLNWKQYQRNVALTDTIISLTGKVEAGLALSTGATNRMADLIAAGRAK